MRIEVATYEAIKFSCLKYHYAKSVPVNVFGYSVFNLENEFCGTVVFGTGANNNIAKMFNLSQGEVIELVRVALNGKQTYTSQVLAMCMKRVKKDLPLCKILVSYADKDQNHEGIIYKATNWIYCGDVMTDKHDSSWIINGKRVHGRVISDMIKKKGGLKGKSRNDFIVEKFDKNAKPYITKGKKKYIYPLRKNYVKLCKELQCKG